MPWRGCRDARPLHDPHLIPTVRQFPAALETHDVNMARWMRPSPGTARRHRKGCFLCGHPKIEKKIESITPPFRSSGGRKGDRRHRKILQAVPGLKDAFRAEP
jgi:hypothetical protein